MISLVDDAVKSHDENEQEKKISSLPITREEAISLLNSFPQEQSDKNHYLESEAIMRGLAKHFNGFNRIFKIIPVFI